MIDFELFDEDGVYPTEELLNYISTYNIIECSSKEFIELVYDCWSYEYPYKHKYEDCGYTVYEMSTGGWSGNEDLVSALMENHLWWAFNWYSSRRGGHHVFKVKHE